jgi:ribosomal protein S18 acetylase RimI-like enzyme
MTLALPAGLTLDALGEPQWPEAAAFVTAANARPDGRVRCLHSEHGRSAEDHLHEMRDAAAAGAVFFGARDAAGALVAWCGAEWDAGLQRAWLRGPLWLPDGHPAGRAAAQAVLGRLHQELPATARIDAFAQVDEAALRQLLRDAGYADDQLHHVMQRAADAGPAPAWPGVVVRPDAAQAAEAGRLHEASFAASYKPAAALAAPPAHHRLFVALADGQVAGYVYVQHTPPEAGAYIDFIAVDERFRGRRLGRALLDAAVHWALVQGNLPDVSLTVRADRAPALGLYLGAGFVEVSVGAHMIRRPAAAPAEAEAAAAAAGAAAG